MRRRRISTHLVMATCQLRCQIRRSATRPSAKLSEVKERPLDLVPKPSYQDALTYDLAIRLLRAVGIQVAGLALAITRITALGVIGAVIFVVGFLLYLFVERRVADVVYPGHWGLLDPRIGFILRIQLFSVGLVRAVRVVRQRRRTGRT